MNKKEVIKQKERRSEMAEKKLDEQEEVSMKKAYIQVRIEESLKNKFYSKCEKNYQIPSVVIRGLIKNFIEEENSMKKEDLLKTLTGEYGEGRSFITSTAWVEENDWAVYDSLHDLMTEFVEDETNLTNEEDLEAFENGDWEVEYTFNGYFEDEEIKILVTAGRNGQYIANQPAWIQETISIDEFMDYWNWEAYLEQVEALERSWSI